MRKIRLFLLLAVFFAFAALQEAALSRALAEDEPPATSDEGGKAEGSKDSKADSKKKASDDVSGGRFVGDPIYVHIQPLVLPIITENGVEQLVNILLVVQVKDMDAASDLHSNMPRVMDSLMRHLYGGLGQGALRNGKLINVSKIKNKAVASVTEVLGRDKIIDVLVQGVSQRVL